MKEFDSETVRKIWQRVQSDKSSDRSLEASACSLSQWIVRELTVAEIYMRLSGKMVGQTKITLQRLAKQERHHASLLKGICTMTEGVTPRVYVPKMQKQPIPVLLRQCYGYKLQALAEYEKRISDSQYGDVFQSLVRQEQEQCRFLLQLIGKIEQKY